MANSKRPNVYSIVLWAFFAALVFVANWLYIPIPVPVGNLSRISLGNVFCLLSGFILGPVGGGLASGVGAALFDLTNPAYIASAPFTFAFKFLLGAVCGMIAWSGGKNAADTRRNIFAAICGSVTYIILYLTKAFVQGVMLGNEMGAVLTSVAAKFLTSGVNGVMAVLISVPVSAAVRAALKRSGLAEKIR